MKKRLNFKFFFSITYLFLIIYSPRFVNINTIHILFGVAAVGTVFVVRNMLYIIRNTKVILFVILTLILGCIVICAGVFNNNSIQYYRFWVMGIELPYCVTFILAFLKKNGFEKEDVIEMLIGVGVIQAMFAVLMIISPDFKMLINSHYAQFWDVRMIGWSKTRMYGFSDNLLHTTPLVQAVISGVVFVYMRKSNIRWVTLGLLLASIAVNSRTALVAMAVCVLYAMYIDFGGKKNNRILGYFVACFVIFITFYLLKGYSFQAYHYMIDGVNEILAFLNQGISSEESVFFYRFSKMVIAFPNVWGMIGGVGIQIAGIDGMKYGVNSDVGFINDIWSGGIFFMLGMVMLYLHMIKEIRQSDGYIWIYIQKIMLVVFLIGHTKGLLTFYNDYTTIMLLLSGVKVLKSRGVNASTSVKELVV